MNQQQDQPASEAPAANPRGFGEPDTCPACDSIFAPSDMIKRISHRTGVRTVSAHCTHCDRVIQVRQVLRGGTWVDDTGVEVVNTEKGRNQVKRALDALRGQLQRAALSA